MTTGTAQANGAVEWRRTWPLTRGGGGGGFEPGPHGCGRIQECVSTNAHMHRLIPAYAADGSHVATSKRLSLVLCFSCFTFREVLLDLWRSSLSWCGGHTPRPLRLGNRVQFPARPLVDVVHVDPAPISELPQPATLHISRNSTLRSRDQALFIRN